MVQQQELFETEKYISDLVEEKTKKKTSTFKKSSGPPPSAVGTGAR